GDPDIAMGTLKKRILDPTDIVNPNVVKVVTNLAGDAIYFSRCAIPYERERGIDGLFQTHWPLCISPRFAAALSRFEHRSTGTSRAPGAVARSRKRVS